MQCLLLCLSAGVSHEVKTALGRVTNPPATEATSKARPVIKLHQYRIKYSKHITKALLGAGALPPDLCAFLSVSVLESQCCIATFCCCCSPEQHSSLNLFACSKLIVGCLLAAGCILTKVSDRVIFPRTEGCPRMHGFETRVVLGNPEGMVTWF